LLVPVADSALSRSAATAGPQIYVIASDGSGQVNITHNTTANDAPDWSPDGTKIAFSTHRDGNWEIYSMNADGTAPTRLTRSDPADDARPAWSPDGTKIAFHSDRTGNYEIFVMNADGTGQTNVTVDPSSDELAPAWSPDGTKIAFQRNGDLFVMNANGTLQTRLTSGPNYDASPDWSPDGTKIVFAGGSATTGFIDVVNADGSARTRLSTGAHEYYPEWSPNGTKIVFVSYATVGGKVVVMNADGTAPTTITNTGSRDDYEPTWAPDGTRLAFAGNIDKTAPNLLILARTPQRVVRQKNVQVAIACDEPCVVRASGVVVVAGQRGKIRLRDASGSIDAFTAKQLKLRLSGAALQRVRAALAQGKRATATVSVRAVDSFGNAGTRTRKVKLKR
jgi:Tol biopolymer transport system component